MSEIEIKQDKLYKMKLHDILEPHVKNSCIDITRVPGGWIYSFYGEDFISPVFVPFNNEFMEVEDNCVLDEIEIKTLGEILQRAFVETKDTLLEHSAKKVFSDMFQKINKLNEMAKEKQNGRG